MQQTQVPDKAACAVSLQKVIKPGGRLVFQEIFLDPDRLSVAELCALFEPRGFELKSTTGTRWRDIVEFTRSAAA